MLPDAILLNEGLNGWILSLFGCLRNIQCGFLWLQLLVEGAVQADGCDVTVAEESADTSAFLRNSEAGKRPLRTCISPRNTNRSKGGSLVQAVILKCKNVNSTLDQRIA